jgi:ketosteroid isomerase-like protein
MHKKIIIAFAVSVSIAGWAVASDETDVMAVVKQWDDAFNTGDTKSALAACADQTSIIDDLPPHEWHGAGGCSRWMHDADAFFKKNEMTNVVSTLGKPRHVDVTGDRAYVVVPATLTYTEKGKPVKDKTATVTMALQKSESGWHITGWSWADG